MRISTGKLAKTISRRKRDIVITVLWSCIVALVVIKAYWIAYNTSARLRHTTPAYPTYDLTGVSFLDLLIVTVAGLVVGLFMSDVKEMLYGYIASMSTAFVVSATYVVFYIWYVLDLGPVFATLAYGWEWTVFIAGSIVFALMFPWIVCSCLVSLTIGAFLRTWIIESSLA